MRTHELRRCAAPRCPEWTIWHHCERHLTALERALRSELDAAVVSYADAEEAYAAAVQADEPVAVVETLEPYRAANRRLRRVEQRLGMVR